MTVTAALLAGIRQFRELGYAVLPGVVGEAELEQLRTEAQAQIDAGPDRQPAGDFLSVPASDGRMCFSRIDTLPAKALVNDSMLLLLGNPAILEAATLILGPDAVVYATSMIFKGGPIGGAVIDPHRDSGRGAADYEPGILSVDVYLDDATPANGCLQVLPGSHRTRDSVPLVSQAWDLEGLIEVPMRAGDVLLHDGMVVHASASPPVDSPPRRVVYPTMQSAGKIDSYGLYGGIRPARAAIAQLLKVQAHAVERRRSAPHLAGEVGSTWTVPEEWAAEVEAAPLDLTNPFGSRQT